MPPLRNRGTIPAGMLAPSGLGQTAVNPEVQATVRPAGSLLQPSPGYDSVRSGKNRFQGKGPSGGFRPQDFAEDVGGTGSVLSVRPGSTTALEASEWLPENADSLPEGSVIIADRTHEPGFAERLHEAYSVIPDMGDRTAERPLSRAAWLRNPIGLIHRDYQQHPLATVLGLAGAVWVINTVAKDLEQGIRGYRPRGVGTAISEPAAAVPEAAGDVTKQITEATSEAVNRIGEAADGAVTKIASAADSAVSKVESAVE